MGLELYNRKRDFKKTPEPPGKVARAGGHQFVIQKHAASHLHYDFRLEHEGVLLSWAVPKGPSLDPGTKRLAMRTEDHPVSYARFEGIIPAGEYGGGTVLLWDEGTWRPLEDPSAGMKKGRLRFELTGAKLNGEWILTRTKPRDGSTRESWLLMKVKDGHALAAGATDITEARPESVISGRVLEEIKKSPDRVWHSKGSARRSGGARPDPAAAPGAKKAKLPRTVAPQLTTLVSEAPAGDDWIHEIKLDGYRLLARVDGAKVALYTRGGQDWAANAPSIARALGALEMGQAVIDGEVVVMRDDGISDFQMLQNSLSSDHDAQLFFYAFDLLHLGGYDLTGVPLLERKAMLKQLLTAVASVDGRVRFSNHVVGGGPAFFAKACEMGVEGIISKRAGDAYVPGRGKSWLKVKCLCRQEVVVVGWSEPEGSREHLGALLVGLHEDGELRYAGKVGTGFSAQSLKELHARLAPLEQKTPPVVDPPKGYKARGVHWVKPKLVAEVAFTAFTNDGKLRHPAFQGLRDDKEARQVVREKPQPIKKSTRAGGKKREPAAKARPAKQGRAAKKAVAEQPDGDTERVLRNVRLTNPDRVLYPELGTTKRDLAVYYAHVHPWILPHVTGRPMTLVRCPEGHDKECFYQKHARVGTPSQVKRIPIRDSGGVLDYLYIEDLEALLSLVQIGVLELHPWGSTVADVERPDMIIMDLDPAPDLGWDVIVEGALLLREDMKRLGLQTFVKTTGGKGLHIVAPVRPRLDWDTTKAFTKALADSLVRRQPKHYIAVMTKAQRTGKIFVDYLRNGRGAHAVAAYSTRARPGAPVSTPITWKELERGVRPEQFDIHTVPERLAALKGDPWEGYFEESSRR